MKRQTRTLLFLAAAGLPLAAAQQTTLSTPPANVQAGAPSAPAQYSGHSRIEQLNYDRRGAVNGFLMSNGVLVFTPPTDGTTAASTMRKGSAVSVTGMSHQTVNGRTVVNAQSLKVGDQTVVFAMGGPGGPGGPPTPPRRWDRGPAGAPPPPPPPPAAPANAQGPNGAAPPPPPAPPQ